MLTSAAASGCTRPAPPAALAVLAGPDSRTHCIHARRYILQTRLGGEPCTWCYTSATISFALLATLLVRMERRQLQDMAGPGLGMVAASMLVLYLNLGPANQSSADDFQLPYAPPIVTTSSSGKAVELARKLKDAGAKMYGAFWCSHCFEQKQTFGAQVSPLVTCWPGCVGGRVLGPLTLMTTCLLTAYLVILLAACLLALLTT